jgi:hypothetical protein
MSTFRLSIILMKAKKLQAPFHHVDENKQERRLTPGLKKWHVSIVAY